MYIGHVCNWLRAHVDDEVSLSAVSLAYTQYGLYVIHVRMGNPEAREEANAMSPKRDCANWSIFGGYNIITCSLQCCLFGKNRWPFHSAGGGSGETKPADLNRESALIQIDTLSVRSAHIKCARLSELRLLLLLLFRAALCPSAPFGTQARKRPIYQWYSITFAAGPRKRSEESGYGPTVCMLAQHKKGAARKYCVFTGTCQYV